MNMRTEGLVGHLEDWGLNVEEKDGWRFRGNGRSFYPRAIICHHTASGSSSGNFASESVVTYGRSDLPGPLCQILLGRNGVVKLIAAGAANHAGTGGPKAGMPEDQGNTYSIGIEAENNGVGEPWSDEALSAYVRLCAALLVWLNIKDVSVVIGHKEWTSRKIDPHGIDMDEFRSLVSQALEDGAKGEKVIVRASKVQRGKRNAHVRRMKRRLRRRGFISGLAVGNKYSRSVEKAVAAFQRAEKLPATGKADWKTLRRLGFKVMK